MCLISNKAVPTLFAAAVVKQLTDYYENNREFYKDFIEFNYTKTYNKPVKQLRYVNFANLPEEAQRTVRKAEKKLDLSTDKLFRQLGTVKTINNRCCPLEAKWAFEYFKKFKTWEYSIDNEVELAELLLPLDAVELTQYIDLF